MLDLSAVYWCPRRLMPRCLPPLFDIFALRATRDACPPILPRRWCRWRWYADAALMPAARRLIYATCSMSLIMFSLLSMIIRWCRAPIFSLMIRLMMIIDYDDAAAAAAYFRLSMRLHAWRAWYMLMLFTLCLFWYADIVYGAMVTMRCSVWCRCRHCFIFRCFRWWLFHLITPCCFDYLIFFHVLIILYFIYDAIKRRCLMPPLMIIYDICVYRCWWCHSLLFDDIDDVCHAFLRFDAALMPCFTLMMLDVIWLFWCARYFTPDIIFIFAAFSDILILPMPDDDAWYPLRHAIFDTPLFRRCRLMIR